MQRDAFAQLFRDLMEEAWSVVETKGGEYAHGSDQLDNFKRIAHELGLDPLQVWATYWHKHVDSLVDYVKRRAPTSEPIRGRFVDLINYCALGAALVKEGEDGWTN